MSSDEFFLEGLKIMAEEKTLHETQRAAREEQAALDEVAREASRDIELMEGKLKRENLKRDLFAYLY